MVTQDQLEIRQLVESWAIWRDSGDWERFATVWAPDGVMWATWLQTDAAGFVEASRRGFESGVNIMHFLGGHVSDVVGEHAIAQTRMEILQRGVVHDVEVDVTCIGRFYDFLRKRDGRWELVRRRLAYEKDWMTPVVPGTPIPLDLEQLAGFPVGYRHLGYLQAQLGFPVKRDMPGTRGPEVEAMYAQGAAWLAGDEAPWG